MKFNLTPLEFTVSVCVCLAVYIWSKHGRPIRLWLQDYFRQQRGPRNLTPRGVAINPSFSTALLHYHFSVRKLVGSKYRLVMLIR